MTGKIKNLFQIPQGTESLSLKEASTHRRITDALEALFLSWGYFPVQTPVFDFFKLFEFPLGSTRMCLAGWPDSPWDRRSAMKIATKFPKFSFDYFHTRSIPVQIIKLEGSVELAPVLGLTDYIVDLVQTGSTLKAHDLAILEVLAEIKVFLIANPADYKVNYKQMDQLAEKLARVNI